MEMAQDYSNLILKTSLNSLIGLNTIYMRRIICFFNSTTPYLDRYRRAIDGLGLTEKQSDSMVQEARICLNSMRAMLLQAEKEPSPSPKTLDSGTIRKRVVSPRAKAVPEHKGLDLTMANASGTSRAKTHIHYLK